MRIQRYRLVVDAAIATMARDSRGEYVLYEDHMKQVQGLVDELAEKERELENYRPGHL